MSRAKHLKKKRKSKGDGYRGACTRWINGNPVPHCPELLILAGRKPKTIKA